MMAPRLRRSMVALGGLLLLVALVSSISLVALTTVLRDEAARVAEVNALTRSSLRTKAALLWYAREADVATSERTPQTEQARLQAEAELLSELEHTRRLATADRVPQTSHLVIKTHAYIALRKQLEAERLPTGAIVRRSTPALEGIFEDVKHIVDADEARTRVVEASAQRWHSVANVLGICAAGLLLAGFAGSVVGVGVLVERPILRLTDAMTRFAGGEETARSDPHGVREIRQAATVFNELADRLVRQREERIAFLAGVAHDLRNPLAALRLATGALQHGPQPPPPEKAERTIAMVGRQVERLDRMVGDLLDATRIASGRLELRLEPVDLRPLVQHVVELFRAVSEARPILLVSPEEPAIVDCDPTRIEQVLTNLLSNAIKYSPGGTRVTVSLSAPPSEAVIAVTDEGIGIPPEDIGRIFEPFQRGTASRELVPGVGLGLSVARKLVEAHGGRLEVESQVGKGSTFRVRLPPSPGPQSSKSSMPSASASAT